MKEKITFIDDSELYEDNIQEEMAEERKKFKTDKEYGDYLDKELKKQEKVIKEILKNSSTRD